ncbi:replication-relaxation family protein [Laceyella putida]|uniref:Replication-relaxation family protein n=1 Tax=Laceyella putida TaxID=110101 RepID=A0ABW2RRC2_9BACL
MQYTRREPWEGQHVDLELVEEMDEEGFETDEDDEFIEMEEKETKPNKRKRRKYYRRAPVAKKNLTLDWLKSQLNVRDVHRKTLKLLAQHRIMNIEQLLYWHEDFGQQKRAKALMQRHLNELVYYYLVNKKDHIHHKFLDGSKRRTIFAALGPLGSKAVGWQEHVERIRYHTDGSVSINNRYFHISRVCDLSIITNEVLKEMGASLEMWVVECRKSIVNHDNNLNPDAFAMIKDSVTRKKYTAFIEFDTGAEDFRRTEKFPELTKKFNRYKEVKEWDGWYKKRVSIESENKFPYVFFVTQEPRRMKKVPSLLKERVNESMVCMVEDYAARLKEFIERMRENA